MVRARIVLLTALVALSGCAESKPAATAEGVTIDNCGTRITFDGVPQRVIGYYQHPTEIMVALGLQDKIVGTAYPDNDPLPRYADVYTAIPKISDKDASFEQLLAKTPDLVYGGYDSTFDDKEGRSREAFTKAGIKTYLSREACNDRAVTMDDVWEEFRTVGRIFQIPERAEAVITELKATVTKTTTRLNGVQPVKVFVFDSGEATAFTSGGTGIGNEVIKLAGGQNVFADTQKDWADVSWEQVLQRSPDVIVIYDYFGTPAVDKKIEFLLGKPELASVPAIKNRKFSTLTLQDTVLGVRAPYAVESLAKQLHP
ncbi:ABC transporter substrate-binding protein [Kibdelosporangium philippinense]|uniref:ABC transporter substrate-binding protein n=2 Tax=Kibdelosporangium philippinense TaxID=211113 RepID=A0ABS8ZSX9_9PSEU|nr:ABC transporter substrate-binding protein [Kibdelosporangium philippinense]MCE7010348.1 ABC transporter substrate-binding protein [Kibdelosporangium philippinense]